MGSSQPLVLHSIETVWSVVRTTQQTGNLGVILVGGTLFIVLTIALTTELFAKNSPSVLYSAAVDMIRESDAVGHTPKLFSSRTNSDLYPAS